MLDFFVHAFIHPSIYGWTYPISIHNTTTINKKWISIHPPGKFCFPMRVRHVGLLRPARLQPHPDRGPARQQGQGAQLVSGTVSSKQQGSAGFPFPGKNGKEKVDFPPFSLPNGKFILFPSHFLPLLIILNISFPFPSHTNSTKNSLPISFPYQK